MSTTKKTSAEPAQKAAKAPTAPRGFAGQPAGGAAKSSAELKAAAELEAAAELVRTALQAQMKQWEEAVGLFSQKQFAAAQAHFSVAAKGPAAHIADKARSYSQICARKMDTAEVNLETADDHFNYGVERLNARDMQAARRHLDCALALEPDGEHILFTLALCCGLSGDGAGACDHLTRAIVLEPKNRILARQDPEFSALSHQFPALRALLMPENAGLI